MMPPLRAYLILRARLMGRLLRELGALRLALLGPLLLLVLGRGLLLAARHPQGQWAVPVMVAVVLASAHRQREDLRFLATSAPAFRRWLAVEYGLLALPAALGLLLFADIGAAALTLVLAVVMAALPSRREARSTRHRGRSLFRSEAFEWVSGMRTGGIWAWPVLLAGAVWQHESPLGPVVALGVWLLVLLANYGLPEPITMLAVAARGVGPFLRRRVLLGLSYAALTGAPLLWLLAVGPASAGGAVAVGLFWLGLVGMIILVKYAFYPNAVHIRTTQGLVVGVALTMFGHPVYPVLLLVALGGLIWQSQRRLRNVLGEIKTNA